MARRILDFLSCMCGKYVVRINGKTYVRRETIGEGGFSTVDLVEEEGTRQKFALKQIICHSVEDERVALTEVDNMRKFQHPNVISYVDHDVHQRRDGRKEFLILLPYYPRGTLLTELEMRGKTKNHLSEEAVLDIFSEICEGVQVMHSAKPEPLAHRDMKPGNILLDQSYHPVIMDLGSMTNAVTEVSDGRQARRLQDMAAETSTMPYRAPELFSVDLHSTVDQRTDIWSLGCLLYALCFFEGPFDDVVRRGDSVALATVSGNIRFPTSSPYSKGLHDLILLMLRVDCRERPHIGKVLDIVKRLQGKAVSEDRASGSRTQQV
ncbi:unnamed protein product [Darwinula stevensoni]|uniref:non-specific serine/threonine protein kinase n=1 Tax=Darwinula stevensoni TaxID=69355 RepID=A0A7R9A3S8_9CRUS|nr:unnamed protein product [Darwinula stevensoni]CAG0888572.1 unnamed protein product [Darwinula stevensoni]